MNLRCVDVWRISCAYLDIRTVFDFIQYLEMFEVFMNRTNPDISVAV